MTQQELDKEINQTLANLTIILAPLSEKTQENSAIEIANALKAETATLQKQTSAYPSNHFSYEFYELGSNIVEQITQFRLNHLLRKLLRKTTLEQNLNQLVEVIRVAVHKHEALIGQETSVPIPSDSDPLLAAQTKLQNATKIATDAADAAEEANAQGAKYLSEVREGQKKLVVSSDLFNKSIDQTLTIYAKNAASVLATDAATSALVEFEKLLESQSPSQPFES